MQTQHQWAQNSQADKDKTALAPVGSSAQKTTFTLSKVNKHGCQTLKFLVAMRRRSAGILSPNLTSTISPTTSSSAWMLHFSPFRITVANYHSHFNMLLKHQHNISCNTLLLKMQNNMTIIYTHIRSLRLKAFLVSKFH